MNLSERLAELKLARELQEKEFPLHCLLRLYAASPRSLYLDHFAGLKEIIKWLHPISISTFPAKSIPTFLLTYEMQEIAKLTGNHISQIYQELTSSWITDYNS